MAIYSTVQCVWCPQSLEDAGISQCNMNEYYSVEDDIQYEEEEESCMMMVGEKKEESPKHADIDEKMYKETAKDQANREQAANPNVDKNLLASGNMITFTMVWTNVYGLGAATFFLSYIFTMASTLSTFSFMAGLSAISIYEAIQERRYFLHVLQQ